MNTEQEKLQVSREAVFKLASQSLDADATLPSLGWLRSHFASPTSPAIAVYFSEWKHERQDDIARIRQTPAQLKAYTMRLQEEIADISSRYKALNKEFQHFSQFIHAHHPAVLSEWDAYRQEAN